MKIEKNIDEDTTFDSTVKLYEDLTKNDNDKYQYIFPDFNFSKNIEIDPNYNGNFQFLSSGFKKSMDSINMKH